MYNYLITGYLSLSLSSFFTGDARLYKSADLGNVAKLNRYGSGALISGNRKNMYYC